MEQIMYVLDIVTKCLNLVSIVILVWGVVVSVKDFLLSRLRVKGSQERIDAMTENKNNLGSYILLGLEILIAADIINTILKPNLQDIILLAVIVAIRTVISVFLNKEIQGYEARKKRD